MSSRSINEVTSKDEGHLVQKNPYWREESLHVVTQPKRQKDRAYYGTDAKDKEAVLDESHFDYII